MIPCGVLRRPLRRLATETEKVGKKRNRFMDNQQFEKFLSQKDFFNLEEKVDWRDMYHAKMHLGHNVTMRNTRMENYIFGCRNGTDIIDLDQTRFLMIQALNFIGHVALRGGTILFMPNKSLKNSRPAILTAQRCGEYCDVSQEEPQSWDFAKASPEMLMQQSDEYRIEPDVVVLLNCVGEKPGRIPKHISTSCERNIPIVALCDTDINPTMISYPVPSNDDHPKSEEYFLSLVENVIIEAKRVRETIPGYSAHWTQSGIEAQFSRFTPKTDE